jgi:HEAT repeat protein
MPSFVDEMGDTTADLVMDLIYGPREIRLDAARALGETGDQRAVSPLIDALKDADSGIRVAAADALGIIGDANAVDPLIAALKDLAWDVRVNAVRALGEIGEPAVDPLIRTLKDEDSPLVIG